MPALVILLFLASCLATITNAATVSGYISTNSILSDLRRLRPSTRVVLNGGQHSTTIRANGYFELTDVAPGSYLLQVQSIDYIFPRVRIDIEADGMKAAYSGYGTKWDNTGYSLEFPLDLKAKATAEYFVQRQKFNIFGMLKNPMFLMIGFSAVLLFVMPKMMANMDPEMLKEFNQSQAEAHKLLAGMSNPSQMLANAQKQQQSR